MKQYLLILSIFSCTIILAQNPDDALRTAWFTQNGSARNIATGGVMGSLGGDITAAHVNPAGLGLFKTNEFVFTPGITFNKNKFNYRGKDTSSIKNTFNYGTIGVVFGTPHDRKTDYTRNSILVNAHWGMQRAFNSHWIFNAHAGAGYAQDIDYNFGTIYPSIDVRISYALVNLKK